MSKLCVAGAQSAGIILSANVAREAFANAWHSRTLGGSLVHTGIAAACWLPVWLSVFADSHWLLAIWLCIPVVMVATAATRRLQHQGQYFVSIPPPDPCSSCTGSA